MFESDYVYFGVSKNSHTGLFEIDCNDNVLELLQEDLDAIKEIIIDKTYNTYITKCIEIYLYNNILTIINDDSDDIVYVDSKYFDMLINSIDKYYHQVPDFEEWCGIKIDENDVQKINVDISVRVAKKFNL